VLGHLCAMKLTRVSQVRCVFNTVNMCEPGEVCLYTVDEEFEIAILSVACVYTIL